MFRPLNFDPYTAFDDDFISRQVSRVTRNSVLIETYLEHRLELLKFPCQRPGSSQLGR